MGSANYVLIESNIALDPAALLTTTSAGDATAALVGSNGSAGVIYQFQLSL